MSDWPAWYYGPDGEGRIFDRAEDVPEGWQDHPDKAKAVAPKPAPVKRKGKADASPAA